MRWKGRRQSRNVEDRRGRLGGSLGIPGNLRLPRGKAGGISGGGLLIILVLALVFGMDPLALLQGDANIGNAPPSSRSSPPNPQQDELAQFVSVVLADTEDTWTALFEDAGQSYELPTLVLFTESVQSACGFGQSAMGPFYCPGDYKVYIDLSFFDEMRTKLQAGGDFAQAYVVAHEVGHHVQNLMGIMAQVTQARRSLSKAENNALSVRVELQADCLAGVWAHHADRYRNLLEDGDIEEGLNAASAIGDDRLQRRATGSVSPESFTHGTSAQRVRWFSNGYRSGRMDTCNTFEQETL